MLFFMNRVGMFRLVLLTVFSFFYIIISNASNNGHIVHSDPSCKIWWTGSTYKIMKKDPVPEKKGEIGLKAAKNETESFQLILSPSKDLSSVSITISGFREENGSLISSENVKIRKVEYVRVTKPSGKLHKAGWYPDPLPMCEASFEAYAGVNTPLWFTVEVPASALPGTYTGDITIRSGTWEVKIPVQIKVWDFTLPNSPYMRSGLNLKSKLIRQYHNLNTEEELKHVTDLYFKSFKDYKISPYYFYDLYPIRRHVKGVYWRGGTFDPDTRFSGRYSYQVNDDNTRSNESGTYTELIEIDPEHPYLLTWQAKTPEENQKYTVTVKCYDENKKPIYWSLKWNVCEGGKNWKADSLFIDTTGFFTYEDLPDYRPFPENARYASVHLYAVLPDRSGSETGTVWFDDFRFTDLETNENLLPKGDFEQDLNALDLELDFSEFDKAARKYLDELGFTGFRLQISELGRKPFSDLRDKGWFNGFISGTPEYKKLITLYLGGLQDHLEANGWLGKEYIYWIDEPDQEHYEDVRRGMDMIHEAAPKLVRFISENNPGPGIMDVTEIGCPVLYKVDPQRVRDWSKNGRQFWSYLMCWPKEPHVNLFIDSDAINMRMWIWISYVYNLEGIIIWQSNQWNRTSGAAPDHILQNIWEDPMTYKSGYGTPYGSAPEFGNGDGMLFYPPNRHPNEDDSMYITGPVPSLRLEILREGLDDYDYMIMLEKAMEDMSSHSKELKNECIDVLNFGKDLFADDTQYVKNPEILMNYRNKMGDLLEILYQNH